MRTSEQGKTYIKSWEACVLTAYPDPASKLGRECLRLGLRFTDYERIPNWKSIDGRPWTIAWGKTMDVHPGMVCTQEQADRWFDEEIVEYEDGVNTLVTVPIEQHEFDALVSFSYNVGTDIDDDTIAEGLGDSTLLKKLNAGDKAGAAAEFPKWNRGPAGPMPGLTTRRNGERKMFEQAIYEMHR